AALGCQITAVDFDDRSPGKSRLGRAVDYDWLEDARQRRVKHDRSEACIARALNDGERMLRYCDRCRKRGAGCVCRDAVVSRATAITIRTSSDRNKRRRIAHRGPIAAVRRGNGDVAISINGPKRGTKWCD